MNSSVLPKIKNCLIDLDGVFKYIQIHCTDSNTKESKIIVRGFKSCAFHPDIYDKFHDELNDLKISQKIMSYAIGGGRIQISRNDKFIKIYGYSQTYGRCNHSISSQVIKECFPDYDVSWSNEGY